MTFEIILTKGLGKPIFVEAENAEEARKLGLARFRYHQCTLNKWPIEKVIAEVKLSDKSAVQYA